MKVGKFTVQFNHKIAGYKTIEEVPYWRVYLIKRTKVKQKLDEFWAKRYGKEYSIHTMTEIIDKSNYNYKFDEVEWICETMVKHISLQKGEMFVAYPRKTFTNRKKMR